MRIKFFFYFIIKREWIAISTCVWVMDKLAKEYKAGLQSTVDLLNYYEIHILPIVNPDGYEFAHTTVIFFQNIFSTRGLGTRLLFLRTECGVKIVQRLHLQTALE